MKLKILLSLFSIFLGLFLATQVLAQTPNPPAEDYRYQLDQYRRHYAEYGIYASDYKQNNTLDNEQKAVLAARSALLARELSLASLVRILRQSINDQNVSYPAIATVQVQIEDLLQYFTDQSELAKKIETKKDLTVFTSNYVQKQIVNQYLLDRFEITNKIAQLLRLLNETNKALAAVEPQLADKKDYPLVKNGLEECYNLQIEINSRLNNLASAVLIDKITTSYEDKDFKDASKELSAIQALLSRFINRIIDLDENYVDR